MLSGMVKHTDSFATCGQITPPDLVSLYKLGFETVINNRPDFEGGPDQPMSDDFEPQARALGIVYIYFPVVSGQITEEQITEFNQLLSECAKPILAFCRSGARSTQLWQLAQSM